MSATTDATTTETKFDRALDDLRRRLEDEYHVYRTGHIEEAPGPDGHFRAVIFISHGADDGRFDNHVSRGVAKVTAINKLGDELEVEALCEGYDHFEVRPAE